jgi:NADH dehydrogenase
MIGPGDAFLSAVAGLVRWPVVPLFGDGSTRLAPAYVDDVAEAAAVALAGPDAHGGVSEVGGPEALAYRTIVNRVAAQLGRHPDMVPVPFRAWDALVAAARLLPSPPITEGQVALMRRDNVPSGKHPGLAAFGVDPTPLDTVLDRTFPVP